MKTCVALYSVQVAQATIDLPEDVSESDAREALLKLVDTGHVHFVTTEGDTSVHPDPAEECNVEEHYLL